MPYIGNPAVVGDSTNSFKLLDDIASYTLTFDASSTSVVHVVNDTLTFSNHRFVNLQRVTYADNGGTSIGGLTDNTVYYVIKIDQSTIKLATSSSNAAAGTGINLTGLGVGDSHTLNIAFDGINTKFKATYSNGIKANVSRAAQLSLSINGVIQQPQDTSNPTVGYGIDTDSTIVFSVAPAVSDKVFGSFIGEVAASFDISDNTVDEFTANGSTTTFTLSKDVPSSEDVLVTLDGVTQYPSTQSNTRAYSVTDNGLIFTSAPAAGVIIQVRHIGFAGAATPAGVTAFYGRGGNVTLKNTDDIAVKDITSSGDVTISGDATVSGNLNISGDITYDEVVGRNLEITGIATVASGIVSTGDFKVGSATTISQDNIWHSGIATVGSLKCDGAATFDSDVSIADKIIHIGDTDTALRFPGTDIFTVETGGTERLRVDSAGLKITDKLIHSGDTDTFLEFGTNQITFDTGGTQRFELNNYGTYQPATVPLAFLATSGDSPNIKSGGTNANDLLFTAGNTERLRITSAGKLLIGHTSSRDDVWNGDGTNLEIAGTTYAGSSITLSRWANSASCPHLIIGKSRGAAVGTHAVVQDDDYIAVIGFAADDGTDLVTGAAQITCEIDGTPGSNDMPGRLAFWTTADGSNSPSERLRISSSGAIGINETSPQSALHVGAGGVVRFERGDGTRYGELFNDNSFVELKASTDPVRVNAQSYLRFDIGGSEKGRFITGGGLCFNGDTTSANALDDYEEGTWTPHLGNVSAPTYGSQSGRYTKIGRYVFCTGIITVSSGLDTTDGSTVNVSGIPISGDTTGEVCLFTMGRYTSLLPQAALDDYTGCRFGGTYLMLMNANNDGVSYTDCNSSGMLTFSFAYQL